MPVVLLAAAATGLAGALFNPAVRAYLAAENAGGRRIEAFATFNIFNQGGILLGPLVGVLLVAVDFRATAAGAAAVFAVLTVRVVVVNRSFLMFAVAMIGSYVLSFQVYLALPLQASLLTPRFQSLLVAAVFVVSGLVAGRWTAAHHALVRRPLGTGAAAWRPA